MQFGMQGMQDDPNGTTRFAVNQPTDDSGEMLLRQGNRVGEKEVTEATAALAEYKSGKSNLENRIVKDEEWYRLRHWELMRKEKQAENVEEVRPEPASAWLFNAITSKHADAMDNIPEPAVLPREESDRQDAGSLSDIIPTILERCGYESTYADAWWDKLKHGTACYGAFWDTELEGGIGDINIKAIDLLNVFWEPGITDIQKSRYLFIVDMVDTDMLEQEYPQFKGKLGGGAVDLKQYVYDDFVDISGKSLVVDCYYKVRTPDGRIAMHLMKFCASCLLYASENDPNYADSGYYNHGKYPIVIDRLYPEKGTPAGFGYVSVCKDPQMYIDKLSQNIMEHSMMATKVRYFVSDNADMNEEEFLDWKKPLVHVAGSSLDETRIKPVTVAPLDSIYVNVMQLKIEEMKETASNRDVNSGGTGSGVTAAAAIAALQEAGNKSSRDIIAASYRSYAELIYLVIELIRQFYDEPRTFRITGPNGEYRFVDYKNENIKDQVIESPNHDDVPTFRRPIFDIKVRAQKRNPYSQLAQNEMAKELYRLGVFTPDRAQEAMMMLEMMEFEGIDAVREKVQQGQTLLNVCQQMSQQMNQMAAIIQAITGKDMGIGGTEGQHPEGGSPPPAGGPGGGNTLAKSAVDAQKATMTSYGENLARRATPSIGANSGSKTAVK